MKVFLIVLVSVISLISCSNDPLESLTSNEGNSLALTRSNNVVEESVAFIYHGKSYESIYVTLGDSMCYSNPEVSVLAQRFDQMPAMVSFCYPNNMVEYFDDEDDFQSQFDRVIGMADSISTNIHVDIHDVMLRSQPKIDFDNIRAAIILYDDWGLMDSNNKLFTMPLNDITPIECSHLKAFGMNDKTSSFIAYSVGGVTLFELFEDDSYRNHCLKFAVFENTNSQMDNTTFSTKSRPRGQSFVSDLKSCHVAGTKRSSWNDRITSVRITRIADTSL